MSKLDDDDDDDEGIVVVLAADDVGLSSSFTGFGSLLSVIIKDFIFIDSIATLLT